MRYKKLKSPKEHTVTSTQLTKAQAEIRTAIAATIKKIGLGNFKATSLFMSSQRQAGKKAA